MTTNQDTIPPLDLLVEVLEQSDSSRFGGMGRELADVIACAAGSTEPTTLFFVRKLEKKFELLLNRSN